MIKATYHTTYLTPHRGQTEALKRRLLKAHTSHSTHPVYSECVDASTKTDMTQELATRLVMSNLVWMCKISVVPP